MMKNESPWVKRANRLPVEADAPSGRVLVHFPYGYKEMEYDHWGVRSPALLQSVEYDYWMAIPPLPKDEPKNDTHSNPLGDLVHPVFDGPKPEVSRYPRKCAHDVTGFCAQCYKELDLNTENAGE